MMKRWMLSSRRWRVWIAGGSLFLLGGCGLSDAQLTGIVQTAVSTGLNALVVGVLGTLFPEAAAGA